MIIMANDNAKAKKLFLKLVMILLVFVVLSGISVFSRTEERASAYIAGSDTPFLRNDYNISSHFEANDEITTNFNIPITDNYLDNYVSSYWVINNEDSVAEIQNHSENSFRIYDASTVTMFGNETTYALINIPVPTTLNIFSIWVLCPRFPLRPTRKARQGP